MISNFYVFFQQGILLYAVKELENNPCYEKAHSIVRGTHAVHPHHLQVPILWIHLLTKIYLSLQNQFLDHV